MARILLKSGCSYTPFCVTPKNWRTVAATTKNPWCITYRFIDPDFLDKYPHGIQKMVKGMNCYADVKQRRAATEGALEELKQMLEQDGYNPILEIMSPVRSKPDSITGYTPICTALELAAIKLKYAKSTLADISVTLRGFRAGCEALKMEKKPVKLFRRSDIIAVLEKCEKLNANWSAARFNKYKANLSMVWSELLEREAVESNPLRDIKKKKGVVKKKRQTLTIEERRIVDAFLSEHYPAFWRFLHIFFHSGSRETELMLVQGKNVDLRNQRFLYVDKKGGQYVEKEKPIKDIALPLWEAALEGCGPEDYVFSKGLRPGPVAIAARQISRRWAWHVKDKKKSRGTGKYKTTLPRIGITVTADFYSLKHSNLTEIRRLLDAQTAAKLAGHTSTKMLEQHYDIGREEDEFATVRKARNAFARM